MFQWGVRAAKKRVASFGCQPKGGELPPRKLGTSPDHTTTAASCPKSRVLVVEDHVFVRQALASLINRQHDLLCCGESDSIAATPIIVAREMPDLVVLDLRLKDGEAFELIGALKFQFPQLRILVLSQCDETLFAEKALCAGASGYLMKQEAAEDVLTAIRTVISGRQYLSRAMDAHLFHNRPLASSEGVPAGTRNDAGSRDQAAQPSLAQKPAGGVQE